MEGADALGMIAEVGIAIAGFAGVIATLRAPGGKIGTYAALRIGGLLYLSATVVLLSLLPFAFHFAGVSSRAIWGLSSGAMVALATAIVLAPSSVGEVYELTTRVGVYKRGLRKGLSEPQAAFNSRNASIDFARASSADV